ncbi:MAG: DUF2807 domain-containing protein [Cyanobacteria bacterium REEB67]|nr:DUF2807 domain-containing protein [Cyanobacteria bacterium REEB67]
MKNFQPLIVPISVSLLAFSLAACSSGAPSAEGGGGASKPGHTVIIGPNHSGGPALKGNDHVISVDRKVEQFHAIELVDAGKVQITVGSPLKVSMLVDDNLVDAIDTKVEGGKLVIAANKDYQANRAATYSVDVPELSEIYVSGDGEVLVNAVKGDLLKIDVSGAGSCFAAGKATNVKINLSGAGNVDCLKVAADNVTLTVSGAGTCKVNALNSLKANVSGAGTVKYLGSPASLNKEVTGTGSIMPMM